MRFSVAVYARAVRSDSGRVKTQFAGVTNKHEATTTRVIRRAHRQRALPRLADYTSKWITGRGDPALTTLAECAEALFIRR